MEAKEAARKRCEQGRGDLVALSRRIHDHPELGFKEEKASAWLTAFLADSGFAVEKGICELPTAFAARSGSGPLHIAFCAEYDCLPEIGHACGHNIIAAASVGAALGLAAVADDIGVTVSVIGTPAEEGGGGKVILLERGAFAGVHAAMMVHPAPLDIAAPPMLALKQFAVTYKGKEAHASAFPEQGINAADALVVAQTAIGLLRQHLRSSDRVHGIVTKGGDAANVVPAHTEAQYIVRAETTADLEAVEAKVRHCFEAGALATGAELDMRQYHPGYAEMRHDPDLTAAYRQNAEALGREFAELPGQLLRRFAGSTDMGNVSLALPAIHPAIGIDSLPAVNHQADFAASCVTEAADRALMDGAVAMAWTAIDAARNDAVRGRLLAK